MPTYEFWCPKCEKEFEVKRPIADFDKPALCPDCGTRGMANQPLEKLLDIKGIADVKIIRIAAAFEIARRVIHGELK